MTLLTDIRDFFVRERVWGLVFLLVLALYGALSSWPEKPDAKQPSPALESLELAEKQLKEEIRSVGGLQEFLKDRPELFWAFNGLSLLLLISLIVGLVVDFLWITRPPWRERLRVTESPPEARTWGIASIFKTILLFILTSLGLSMILSLLKSNLFHGWDQNLLILLHTTFSDLLMMGWVVYFVRRLGGRWEDLGFRKTQPWKDFWVGLTGYMAILPLFLMVLIVLMIVSQLLAYEPPPHPLVEIFLEEEKRSPWLVAYSIFLACVAGPVFEEVFFRGFCYPAFKKRWGVVWALVLSAAFFALIHQNTFAFWPIFILGVGLGYLYEKRGTLFPSIVLHVVHNSVFITYFFLAKAVLEGN